MADTEHPAKDTQDTEDPQKRRTFLANLFMGVGLTVSHLTAVGFALRFLYPADRKRAQRLLVGLKTEFPPGSARPFRTPQGQTINIVRSPAGFVALSTVCPHLGCRVHWDSGRSRFICPCHDGHFDAQGAPLSGPPADMKASLARFKVVEDGNLVFIELMVS